jgi:hypothetical protein
MVCHRLGSWALGLLLLLLRAAPLYPSLSIQKAAAAAAAAATTTATAAAAASGWPLLAQ